MDLGGHDLDLPHAQVDGEHRRSASSWPRQALVDSALALSRLAPDRGAKPPLQEAPRMQEWRDAKEAPIAIPFKQ